MSKIKATTRKVKYGYKAALVHPNWNKPIVVGPTFPSQLDAFSHPLKEIDWLDQLSSKIDKNGRVPIKYAVRCYEILFSSPHLKSSTEFNRIDQAIGAMRAVKQQCSARIDMQWSKRSLKSFWVDKANLIYVTIERVLA